MLDATQVADTALRKRRRQRQPNRQREQRHQPGIVGVMEDAEPGKHRVDLGARERSDIDADIALGRGDLAIAVVVLEIKAAARKDQLDARIERGLVDQVEHDAA